MLIIKLRIFNCRIEFKFYFFAICSIFLIVDNNFFLITLIVSILHELGHIISILFFKKRIQKIIVNAFSVDIIQNSYNLSYPKELFIILSGPILNIILYILAETLCIISKLELLKYFAVQNLLIGMMNLLPISSLDGGRAFAILLRFFFDERTSYKVSCVVSILFIIPIFFLGFCSVLKYFNFSILILAIYLSSFLVIRN